MANTELDAAPNLNVYYGWFAVLAALTLAAVGVSFTELGDMRVKLNMLIAVSQATILLLFFMHLKKSDRMTWLTVGATLFWLFLLFGLILTDYFTRKYGAL